MAVKPHREVSGVRPYMEVSWMLGLTGRCHGCEALHGGGMAFGPHREVTVVGDSETGR